MKGTYLSFVLFPQFCIHFSLNLNHFQIMIIDYKLTYPSGTATAVLINGFHTPRGDKMAKYVPTLLAPLKIRIYIEFMLLNIPFSISRQEASSWVCEIFQYKFPLEFLPVVLLRRR